MGAPFANRLSDDVNFDRPFNKEKDVLKIISISRATFYSWQSEWISKGGDPKDMGKIILKGSSSVYWNGPLFLDWMIKHKIKHDPKYDYEEEHKNKALVVINNLKKRK